MNQRGQYGPKPTLHDLNEFEQGTQRRSEANAMAVLIMGGLGVAAAVAYGSRHGKTAIDFLTKER